jgi:hypothetical protein
MTSIRAQDLVVLIHQAATETALTLSGDTSLRFGEQTDIKIITSANPTEEGDDEISGRQIARYLSKYVTKSVADFGIGTHRFSPDVIDQLGITEHVRDILRTIATISAGEPYIDMLAWIHTLGYRGHIITKSQQFSTTMTTLRERGAAWRKSQTGSDTVLSVKLANDPIPWQFRRLGLDSLGDRALVVSASRRAQERRIAARQCLGEGA